MGTDNTKPQKFFGSAKNVTNNPNASTQGLKIKIKLMVKLENADSSTYSFKAFDTSDNAERLLVESEESSGSNSIASFLTFFIMDYFFEKQQTIKIVITKGSEQIVFNTSLGNIVGSRNNTLKKPLGEPHKETIEISSVELKGDSNQELRLMFELGNKSDFDLNKKKYRFYYEVATTSKLYQSENLHLDGTFYSCSIPSPLLGKEFTISFYHPKKKNVVHSMKCSPEDFVNNSNNKTIKFQFTKHHEVQLINKSEMKPVPSFIDYLHSGMEINLTIAIDFTSSNGNPNSTGSLHSLVLGRPNFYEEAIMACGNILCEYDSDQMFPVYGFGAKVNGSVSMCFSLNMQADPEIHTISKILEEYRKNVPNLHFWGPTNFAPVIKKVTETIEKDNNQCKYNILMILTDGAISDMEDTIKYLVKGSTMPLSVIIIGIGSGGFGNMEVLDADDKPLVSGGVTAARDLVQFVPFNQYKDNPKKLAEEVLKEVPDQIMEYYDMNNILPDTITQMIRSKNNK